MGLSPKQLQALVEFAKELRAEVLEVAQVSDLEHQWPGDRNTIKVRFPRASAADMALARRVYFG